jgi:hypothetical protein
MKDNSMEDELQHMDDKSSLKENWEEKIHYDFFFYEWSLCNNKHHDVYD